MMKTSITRVCVCVCVWELWGPRQFYAHDCRRPSGADEKRRDALLIFMSRRAVSVMIFFGHPSMNTIAPPPPTPPQDPPCRPIAFDWPCWSPVAVVITGSLLAPHASVNRLAVVRFDTPPPSTQRFHWLLSHTHFLGNERIFFSLKKKNSFISIGSSSRRFGHLVLGRRMHFHATFSRSSSQDPSYNHIK